MKIVNLKKVDSDYQEYIDDKKFTKGGELHIYPYRTNPINKSTEFIPA